MLQKRSPQQQVKDTKQSSPWNYSYLCFHDAFILFQQNHTYSYLHQNKWRKHSHTHAAEILSTTTYLYFHEANYFFRHKMHYKLKYEESNNVEIHNNYTNKKPILEPTLVPFSWFLYDHNPSNKKKLQFLKFDNSSYLISRNILVKHTQSTKQSVNPHSTNTIILQKSKSILLARYLSLEALQARN